MFSRGKCLRASSLFYFYFRDFYYHFYEYLQANLLYDGVVSFFLLQP